ncbi:MAG TPA: histidine kinase [Bryobacteraceae bacterium]
MMTGTYLRNPILINTIGHTAGLLLFGFIIALLIRDRRAHGMRQMGLSLIAATLALAWNVGSLMALAPHDPSSITLAIVMTASFSILSFLPAVLLQVALNGQHRWILRTGYAVSTTAALLHSSELFFWNAAFHQIALIVIAVGFGLLTAIAFFVPRWGRLNTASGEPTEWVSLACLLLFTSSFLHFGYQHVRSPWAAEIAWHHIGIPVVLIVLLRDYRFLLLDTFVRFLVNSGLATLYIAAVLLLNQRFRIWNAISSSMFLTGLTLVALCVSLILFAYIRNVLQNWIGRTIFRRKDFDKCVRGIVKAASQAYSEDDVISSAAQEVAAHLRVDQFAVITQRETSNAPDQPSVLFGRRQFCSNAFWPEAQIPLRFSGDDVRFVLMGARRGRQRYLSEDLEDMRRLGSVVVEQVERFRSEELKRLATQAELRALQAQINPHFLFNALNTLYGTIDRGSYEARRMVLNLAEIFRYFLQRDRTLIPLSEELRIVEAYLEIEALRLGNRLETELVVSDAARSVVIPILSIQPLVENAVKHGIAGKSGGGRVCLRAEKTTDGLLVNVEDTGTGFDWSGKRSQDSAGIGLDNVRRRLTLCYGAAADLKIRSDETGTVVTFLIPDRSELASVAAEIELAV